MLLPAALVLLSVAPAPERDEKERQRQDTEEKEKSEKTEKSAREEREKSRVFSCTVLIRAYVGPAGTVAPFVALRPTVDMTLDHLAVLVVHKYDSTVVGQKGGFASRCEVVHFVSLLILSWRFDIYSDTSPS
jgi:hypothetical protein